MPSDPNTAAKSNGPECDLKTLNLTLAISSDDDDDFQNPSLAIAITQNLILSSLKNPNSSKPLKPSNGPSRKKQKPLASNGKENRRIPQPQKLNNSRVSKVRKVRKVVREERGNLSASIRSGSVEISKFKEGDGVEEEKSCILSSNESKLVENRQTGEIDFKLSRVSNVLQENKAVGEEWRSRSAPLGSGSVEIIPNFVSNTCDSFDCDQLKPIAVKGDEGDEVKEEKSCLLTSTDSKLLEYWQTGEFDLNISKGCEDSRGVKEEISCLLASNDSKMVENLQIGDFDFKNFRGFEDTRGLKEEKGSYHVMLIESRLLGLRAKSDISNVGDVSGDFEPGINEEKLCVSASTGLELVENWQTRKFDSKNFKETMGLKEEKGSYYSMSIESRLLESRAKCGSSNVGDGCGDFELGTQLNVLMDLCCEMGEEGGSNSGVFSSEGNDLGIVSAELQRDGLVECPLCGTDITGLSEQLRQVHTNDCLDKDGTPVAAIPIGEIKSSSPQQFVDVNPVLEWLRTLGLSRYEEAFVREEIDWETLQWLTEENLLNIGVVALGPRKKIVHALSELRQRNHYGQDREKNISNITTDENTKLSLPGNKLITEYFQGHAVHRNSACSLSKPLHGKEKTSKDSVRKRANPRSHVSRGKVRDIPHWCCIPGTPFLVDAFRFLRGDCSHWFLTHFHLDHYQGLTRNFCHGKIYCSSITAHLVNMKIGVPWDRLQILPLNQKITVAGVNLTCLDANHCPGSIIILFEPPNGKAVLHTGDFRFSSEMASSSVLQSCHVHTLILDTTYCNPQYDFPKQEAVIQFVIEAIQAEAFNPKTLFLIGTYTIGKERLFLEVARLLKKKIYVGAAKLRLLRCLGLPEEDMQWFTANEMESHIHVVPMWTIASFKRMKHISNQYSGRFNLIVAFSPTGWTFGKGKKKTPGRRWQQGTIIRYEVPYSEHCSFTELREFVQFISPEHIIPSVNNEGPESADAMTALLLSDP